MAAALLSARYDLELRGDKLAGFVEFEAQSFGDEWTLLPLAGSDMQVHKIEPPAANIVLREDAYALLTNRPAKQQIKLHFTAALVQEGENARLRMSNAPALVNLLTVRGIPSDKSLQIANATQILSEKGVASFRIAPRQNLEMRLSPVAHAAPVASKWQVSAQCLARFSDEVLRYEAHVTAIATGGSALGLQSPRNCFRSSKSRQPRWKTPPSARGS